MSEELKNKIKTGTEKMKRRSLLTGTAKALAAAATAPLFIHSSALGKAGTLAPSNRINLGFIGTGNMGTSHLRAFLQKPDARVIAVCDVDSNHRNRARKMASLKHHQCYNDFRKLIARSDIDAVVIATPDHWHVPIALTAVRAGKDVYCEKPLTLTVEQGRILSKEARQHNRVFQTGSQQRSNPLFHIAGRLATEGSIGQLKKIEIGLPPSKSIPPQPVMNVPEGFDYNMWLGPAPWKPYTKLRCHRKFRYIFDYSGGKFIDWGAHHLDIVQMVLTADQSGPTQINGWGVFPTEGIYDTAVDYSIDYTYDCGVIVTASTRGPKGIKFLGTKGWVQVNRSSLDANPESLLKKHNISNWKRPDHRQNFLDSIKYRRTPVAPAEVGHRSATLCHLGNISMLTGRNIHWDPLNQRIINDPHANRMLSRPMRSPWHL